MVVNVFGYIVFGSETSSAIWHGTAERTVTLKANSNKNENKFNLLTKAKLQFCYKKIPRNFCSYMEYFFLAPIRLSFRNSGLDLCLLKIEDTEYI